MRRLRAVYDRELDFMTRAPIITVCNGVNDFRSDRRVAQQGDDMVLVHGRVGEGEQKQAAISSCKKAEKLLGCAG